jgi:exosortase
VDAALFAVILLSHLPLLLVHFRRLFLYEHYHFFPFVIAAFAYFTWQRWPARDSCNSIGTPKLESALVIAGFAFLAASTLAWSSWLTAVGAILTIGATLLHFGGRRAMPQLLSAWLLLWFMIPIPFRWDVRLIFELQTVASTAASYVLDFLGVNHLLAGHVLEIPHQQFLVEEACSGIHSLFALLAFGAILMVIWRRPWLHSALLLVSAAFWATSINVIRVVSVVAAFDWTGTNLSAGWKHELLGLALFGLAIVMLLSTDRLLLFLFDGPEPDDADLYANAESTFDRVSASSVVTPTDANPSPPTSKRNRRFFTSWPMAGLFGVLGLFQVLALCVRADALHVVGEATVRLDNAFQAGTLPQQLNGWQQITFKSDTRKMTDRLGKSFSAWTYRSDDATALVQINYPFLGWHHLPACYQAQGWQIESIDTTTVASKSGPEIDVWRLSLNRPSGETMQVRFSQFDSRGQPVRPNAWQLSSLRKTFQHNPFTRLSVSGAGNSTYQVTMHLTGSHRFSESQHKQLTQDFLACRERLLETILKKLHDDE